MKQDKIKLLKAATTEQEYRTLLNGASLFRQIEKQISASAAKEKYLKIVNTVGPLRRHDSKAVSTVATNMIKEAKEQYEEGSFGTGLYLIP